MAVKTKEKTRRETVWVNVSFYRLCPQMASTFLQEQSPFSTGMCKACNGASIENGIECQCRCLVKPRTQASPADLLVKIGLEAGAFSLICQMFAAFRRS